MGRHHDLFDGFESHQTPAEADYANVIQSGCVVVDANVLLNLYRYNPKARGELLAVLEALGERLFVPHQAAAEFWRNRESAMRDPDAAVKVVAEQLAKSRDQAVAAVRHWGARVALPDDRIKELVDEMEATFDNVSDAIDQQASAHVGVRVFDTNDDTLLSELAAAVAGCVGPAIPPAEIDGVLATGHKRMASRTPPGYMDASKDGDGGLGDYIVWEQVLREAAERTSDVLFVTADVKEDWWRRDGGQTRGPRIELLEEFRQRTGQRLLMVQPRRLFQLAKNALAVSVTEEALEDVARVDRLLTHDGGWTHEACMELFARLRSEGFGDRTRVMTWAAENAGFIHRDAVYEVCGYPPSRQLKGFSRPIKRITAELKRQGMLAPTAPDLLETVYDPGVSYVQASGFRLHEEVVDLIAGSDDDEGDSD